MGRQHFRVGIDVDALSFRLLQQFLECIQVMPCHHNTLTFNFILADCDWLWNPEAIRMRTIQQIHDANRRISNLHRHFQMLLRIKVGIGQGHVQSFVGNTIHLRIAIS
ncbi:hypothetical protein D3C76_1334620 [compost metagenome]